MREYKTHPADMPESIPVRSMPDVLRWRAETQGDRTALIYLPDGETEGTRLSYFELDRRARAAAALLQGYNAKHQAVVLLFQPGPEFAIGFLACLYAGAMGVPLYPPDLKRLNRTLPRFLSIVEDCNCNLILTTSEMRAMGAAVLEFAPQLKNQRWLAVDEIPSDLHDQWKDPDSKIDEVAFLQYTSGSTGDPKGVIVSHRSLLLNFALLHELWGVQKGETSVTWLPNYHDMGLIDGWMRPFFAGSLSVAMPPLAFLKQPFTWLNAISKYHASVSGGPNFAYELCIHKITDEQTSTLDLSRWRTAYNGAEPVRTTTLHRFYEKFRRAGLAESAQIPSYGLAEAGLLVSVGSYKKPWTEFPIKKRSLENHEAVRTDLSDPDHQMAIGCGVPELETRIVDPETRCALPPYRVGEIWVGGPSLASGYWNRPEATQEVFGARLADSGEGPYLRTGDLGYFDEHGELFIGGRRKDLIIIRGRNLYPQDVERTVEESDRAAFRPGCNAAFSIEVAGEERLVVVQEVQRRTKNVETAWRDRRVPDPRIEAFAPELEEPPDFTATLNGMRQTLTENIGVDPYAVALIKAGTIPKTSSGKIQRRATKEAFLKGGLDIIAEWHASEGVKKRVPADLLVEQAQAQKPLSRKAEEIRQWLTATIAERLNLAVEEVTGDRPFAQLGLDSKEGLVLLGDLERMLHTKLAASLLYDHPSINRLAAYLETCTSAHATLTDCRPAARSDEPIAIVGIGCRFPGADNPEAFWKMLCEGRDGVRDVPPGRWNPADLYDADPAAPGKLISNRGGFIDGIEMFDPRAFDISPREAARMDPQQRMLLEVAWEALERAGMPPRVTAGTRTGVFVGISSFDYSRILFSDRQRIDAFFGTGVALSIAANRLSYLLDLHGPSMAIDSACSSSLVAVHMAARSIRNGECEMALAGGVNAVLYPDIAVTFTKAGVLSPDGACRTFDASANGMIRGEGAGIVILKPLSRALADGDAIWALLLGGAVNSDGRSNGLMAPNGSAQADVLRQAYLEAGVSPAAVQYVEAHGTGTHLGDPIEVGALAQVLGPERNRDHALRIGSVKSNIGHLEAAAGVAGLIKVTLALKHRMLPPSIHYQTPNPAIHFEDLPIRVQDRLEPWPAAPGQALAGVSAFGFGGTNAHVILKEPPATQSEGNARPDTTVELIPLSARSETALRALAAEFRRFVAEAEPGGSVRDLAYTASVRRGHASCRLALTASNKQEVQDRLDAFLAHRPDPAVVSGQALPDARRKIAFIFPGQGGQWWAMGRGLLETEPVFRQTLEHCHRLLASLFDFSLLDELAKNEEESRIHNTEITQPALVSMQIALCELWRSYGIKPDFVVGHSMGEVTAAYVAGRIRLEDAMRIAYHRGQIMTRARGRGTMAAVQLSLEEAQTLADAYPQKLSVAVNNSPASCVIAGQPDAVHAAMADLAARDIFCRELRVEVAGHSIDMEPLKADFMTAIGELPQGELQTPIVSTVTGARADDLAFDAAYWADNLREPVRFRQAVETLIAEGCTVFLELSPNPVLQNPMVETAAGIGATVHCFYSLRRKADERASMLAAAGSLYTLGFPLQFPQFYPLGATCLTLPTTPWDKIRCWLDLPADDEKERDNSLIHPFLQRRTEFPDRPGAFAFEREMDLARLPLIADHRVQDHAVFPATGYLEMVRAAAGEAFGDWRLTLENVRFHRALILDNEPRRVHLSFEPHPGDAGRSDFSIHSRLAESKDAPWVKHVSGILVRQERTDEPAPLDVTSIRLRCAESIDSESHYKSYLNRSIAYTGAFQTLRSIRRGEGEALGLIAFDADRIAEAKQYRVHPGLLDACLQVMGQALPDAGGESERTYMPVGIRQLLAWREPPSRVFSHAVLRADSTEPGTHTADVTLADETGRVWGLVVGLQVQRLDAAELADATIRKWLYGIQWEAAPRPDKHAEKSPDGKWLLLGDKGGFAEKLSILLRDRGTAVVMADAGEEYGNPATDRYRLNPTQPDHMQKLLSDLRRDGQIISRVVYLWGLDAPGAGNLDSPTLRDLEARIAGGLLHLTKALTALDIDAPLALWTVTRLAQSLPGDQNGPSIAQTPLWGLGRSLAHEAPRIWGGLIDMDESISPEMLLEEIARPADDDQIALRSEGRFVPRLEPQSVADRSAPLSCDPDAAYLITGGLGAIGRSLAGWLADRGARKLILTGRKKPPTREQWQGLADQGDPAAKTLLELTRAGVTVYPVQADSADKQAMAQALALPGAPLKGVIHAAGVVLPRSLADLTLEDLQAEMEPKVQGAWLLHDLTKDMPLDFFVAFSSGSAVWGSKMLAAYGAANHFMDGLCQFRRRLGLPALSVNWAMWGGGGMAADTEHDRFLKLTGLIPMEPKLALAALERLLAAGAVQQTVAAIDWNTLKPLYEIEPRRMLLAKLETGQTAAQDPQDRAQDGDWLDAYRALPDQAARRAWLLDFVAGLVAQVLGVDKTVIQTGQSLLSQGLDSLTANDLRGRLQRALNVNVNVLSLLKGDSPEQTAAALAARLAEAEGENAGPAPRTAPGIAAPNSPEQEQLDPDIRIDNLAPAGQCDPAAVLLTGATGFLGSFVLAELIRQTRALVYCHVRAQDDAQAALRLRAKLDEAGLWTSAMETRVIPIAGDLGKPRLGLSQTRWDELARETDQIFHVGFLVNFLFGYQDLRPANVLATVDLLRLAAQIRVKPMEFVSSFSLLLTPEHAGRTIGDDETLYPATGAYRETKRASELLIGQARTRGVPCRIYRPPFIGWHSQSGYFNERDFLIKLITGCLDLGAAPDLDTIFYIAPVDFVSRALVRLALTPEASGGNFNLLTEPDGLTWDLLVDRFNEAGAGLAKMPFARWREKLSAAGTKNPLHIFFPMFRPDLKESGSAVLELFDARTAPASIDLERTYRLLGATGGFGKVTSELAGKLLTRRSAASGQPADTRMHKRVEPEFSSMT